MNNEKFFKWMKLTQTNEAIDDTGNSNRKYVWNSWREKQPLKVLQLHRRAYGNKEFEAWMSDFFVFFPLPRGIPLIKLNSLRNDREHINLTNGKYIFREFILVMRVGNDSLMTYIVEV